SDLVGKFINIASRTSGFIHKYFEGKLFLDDSKTDQEHISISQKCKDIENEIKTCFEAREFGRAVREIMRVADITNEYVNTKAPWTLAKDDAQHKPGSEAEVLKPLEDFLFTSRQYFQSSRKISQYSLMKKNLRRLKILIRKILLSMSINTY
ncbi:MAG: methionyl-tRNA synthetase, partial [Pseudomonadota bacterium]